MYKVRLILIEDLFIIKMEALDMILIYNSY